MAGLLEKNSDHVSVDATQNPNIIIYDIHGLCSMNVIDVVSILAARKRLGNTQIHVSIYVMQEASGTYQDCC